jgi:hypothetical protein
MKKVETTKEIEKIEEKDISQELVLVGFGKHDLIDMINWIDTDQEKEVLMAAGKWPARWRRYEICTTEELDAMKTFVEFTHSKLNKKVFGGL